MGGSGGVGEELHDVRLLWECVDVTSAQIGLKRPRGRGSRVQTPGFVLDSRLSKVSTTLYNITG